MWQYSTVRNRPYMRCLTETNTQILRFKVLSSISKATAKVHAFWDDYSNFHLLVVYTSLREYRKSAKYYVQDCLKKIKSQFLAKIWYI